MSFGQATKDFILAQISRERTSVAIRPVEHVYMNYEGRRVHYQVAGPEGAAALVLLHGIGGNVNWWQENLAAFSQNFRTYALDLPGFGYSWRLRERLTIEAQAHFVAGWLRRMGLERVHLLGHSMGGQIAARLAAQHPAQVERLVLVAPSGLFTPTAERLRWAWQMPRVRVPLHQTLTIATGTLRTDLLALGLSLRAIISDREAASSLARLTAPTLVIWGGADGVLPPSLGSRTLELIRQAPARLELVERGTHNVMFDQAENFNALVIDFLKGTATP